jgi:hypothetical protein
MKNKKTKITTKEKELTKAYAILKKYGIKVVGVCPSDFADEYFDEQWKLNGKPFKPTKEELQQACNFSYDYFCNETMEIMVDAVEKVVMRKSFNLKK